MFISVIIIILRERKIICINFLASCLSIVYLYLSTSICHPLKHKFGERIISVVAYRIMSCYIRLIFIYFLWHGRLKHHWSTNLSYDNDVLFYMCIASSQNFDGHRLLQVFEANQILLFCENFFTLIIYHIWIFNLKLSIL